MDFGSARFAIGNKTSTFTIMLTSGFAPFEQYHQKGRQGPWTDLYACAATLYFLTTGKVPPDAVDRQYQDNLIAPIQLNPRLTESFNNAVLKALAVEVQNRPQSVAAFRNLSLGSTFGTAGYSKPKMDSSTKIGSTGQITAQLPGPTTATVHLPKKRASLSCPSRQEQKAGPGKLKLGILIVFTRIMTWDRSENHHSVESQFQQPTPILTTNTDLDTETVDENEDDYELSYASMPKIEEVGDTFFPDENQSTNRSDEIPIQTRIESPFPTTFPVPLPPVMRVGPNDAIQACRGIAQSAQCQLRSPQGSVRGHCIRVPGNQLACLPEPPPRFSHSNPVRSRKPFNR